MSKRSLAWWMGGLLSACSAAGGDATTGAGGGGSTQVTEIGEPVPTSGGSEAGEGDPSAGVGPAGEDDSSSDSEGASSGGEGSSSGSEGSSSGSEGSSSGSEGVSSGGEGSSSGGEAEVFPEAAADAAANHSACTKIAPFYWEIGDEEQVLVGDQIGVEWSQTTAMQIASASKWVFGTYVLEATQDVPDALDPDGPVFKAASMQSGWTGLDYNDCTKASVVTIQDCLAVEGLFGQKVKYSASKLDKFNYDGGHFQVFAAAAPADGGLGLGASDDADLQAEFEAALGLTGLAWDSPQPAGGMYMNAQDYAAFLRKILRDELTIGVHLGDAKIPTQCTGCDSPTSSVWSYSWGHWVEDDVDGAFSSPGYFGFYPWIDATETYYGIVARKSADLDLFAAINSAECGAHIRKAFLTGSP